MVTNNDNLHGERNKYLNYKSIEQDELLKIWVGLFMIFWKPKLGIERSVKSSKLVLSLLHQNFDF